MFSRNYNYIDLEIWKKRDKALLLDFFAVLKCFEIDVGLTVRQSKALIER